MNRHLALVASLLGFTGVGFGAFGAHGLKHALEQLPDAPKRLEWWETAARYHLIHALALGLCAVMAAQIESKLPRVAATLFLLGIALFSGSLYAMAATGVPLGRVTPLGGLCLLGGWLCMALASRAPGAKKQP